MALEALESITAELRAVVYDEEDTVSQSLRIAARRAALRGFTYATMTHIRPWGLAAVGDHAWKGHRYRLDHIQEEVGRGSSGRSGRRHASSVTALR